MRNIIAQCSLKPIFKSIVYSCITDQYSLKDDAFFVLASLSLASSTKQILKYHDFWHRSRRAAGSIPARDLKLHFRFYFWLGLINVYKFQLDNFHLQYTSNFILSSGCHKNLDIYPYGTYSWQYPSKLIFVAYLVGALHLPET